MSPQIFGLVLLAGMLAAAVYVFLGGRALLRDGRERRRYRALIDEARVREVQAQNELHELEVQHALSGLDGELAELLNEGRA